MTVALFSFRKKLTKFYITFFGIKMKNTYTCVIKDEVKVTKNSVRIERKIR